MVWNQAKLSKSAQDFELVIPTLEHYFGGKIIKVEDTKNDVCRVLDYGCAIDGLVITDQVFGIAHRVNYCPYENFTVRFTNGGSVSEWDHITRPGIKPRYHVQSIIQGAKVIKTAIVRTEDLVQCIYEGLSELYTNKTTGAQFVSIDWITIQSRGFTVDILEG